MLSIPYVFVFDEIEQASGVSRPDQWSRKDETRRASDLAPCALSGCSIELGLKTRCSLWTFLQGGEREQDFLDPSTPGKVPVLWSTNCVNRTAASNLPGREYPGGFIPQAAEDRANDRWTPGDRDRAAAAHRVTGSFIEDKRLPGCQNLRGRSAWKMGRSARSHTWRNAKIYGPATNWSVADFNAAYNTDRRTKRDVNGVPRLREVPEVDVTTA